jgi:hypothetical protein
MRVMVFAKANEPIARGEPPTAEAIAAMDRFNDAPTPQGVTT